MKVQVRLFAIARQFAGSDTIELDLPQPASAGQLREALIQEIAELQPLSGHLRIAVNANYVSDETPIGETDELACIPPVSGG